MFQITDGWWQTIITCYVILLLNQKKCYEQMHQSIVPNAYSCAFYILLNLFLQAEISKIHTVLYRYIWAESQYPLWNWWIIRLRIWTFSKKYNFDTGTWKHEKCNATHGKKKIVFFSYLTIFVNYKYFLYFKGIVIHLW